MKRAEREHLIERYLQGGLTPAEEENFFIEVASNSELRCELKAYQVVEKTLVRDRSLASSSYSTLRAHLAESLVAGTTVQQGREHQGSPSSASGTAGGPGWIVTISLIGLTALTALVIGILAISQERPVKVEPVQTTLPLHQEGEPSVPMEKIPLNPAAQSATTSNTGSLEPHSSASNAKEIRTLPQTIEPDHEKNKNLNSPTLESLLSSEEQNEGEDPSAKEATPQDVDTSSSGGGIEITIDGPEK